MLFWYTGYYAFTKYFSTFAAVGIFMVAAYYINRMHNIGAVLAVNAVILIYF